MAGPTPSIIEQMPAGGNVSRPQSGSYGEKAEAERLKQALPQSDAAPPQQAGTPPSGFGTAPSPTRAPALPPGLLAPTTRPDVPVSTPLAVPTDPFAGAVDARQRRLRMIDIISTHPDASPELKEWASVVKQKLIARG